MKEAPLDLLTAINETKAALIALDELNKDGVTGRSLSIAYTKMQEGLMWLNKYRFNDSQGLSERHYI